MTLDELYGRLASWHARRFGPGVRIAPTLAKLHEEVAELSAAVLGDGPIDDARVADVLEEAADVAIVLVHLCRGVGGNLHEAMCRKLEVIEDRAAEGSGPVVRIYEPPPEPELPTPGPVYAAADAVNHFDAGA